MKTLSNILKNIIVFIIGGGIYNAIEIMVRGYTHWTMFLLAGICCLLIGWINEIDEHIPIEHQIIMGGCIITSLELITGYIVNILLEWNVWDYSNEPFNFLGQICLSHSIYWVLLSLFAVFLDDFVRHSIGENSRKYYSIIFKKFF
jgi:uncharacterized membrane protein